MSCLTHPESAFASTSTKHTPTTTTPVTVSYEEEYRPQYCTLCDQTMASIELMRNHLDLSGRHPYCTTCHRGFLNNNSYRLHLIVSDYHHFCNSCEMEFKSKRALKIVSVPLN